jgi:DnaK suppressor protein
MTKKKEEKFLNFTGKKKQYYDALMTARAKVMSQVQFHTDEALSSEAVEKGGMATHMADLGSDNSLHDMELQLLTEEGDVVELIEEAIQRLKDDEFGLCQDCGCKIPHERLIVKPYATYCTTCKSRMEQGEY